MPKQLSFLKNTLKLVAGSFIISFLVTTNTSAQFTPVAITGFNHDCVAESGTSSLTTTTIPLDGVPVSNKVMYTVAFRTLNGFSGGGIPDNGIITDAAGSYQLAPYTGNNVLLLQRAQNGDLNLVTPAKFTTIRVLCFSTEGTSMLNATLFFTDGTTATALSNYSLLDWFNNTTNLVVSGFGRCTRATPASGADGFPTNPRMYYIEINLSCANQQKNLQKINFANVTTAGNNAPYPNAVFLGISGKSYSQTISAAITPASCGTNNGSVTLTVTGSTSPFTISWNTIPVQTGVTASNLAPGNYQATITDVNGCTTVYPVTITSQPPPSMTVSTTNPNCTGNGIITITPSGGTVPYQYSINGGSTYQSSNVFSGLGASTYNVVVRDAAGCMTNQQVTLTVINNLIISNSIQASVCLGGSFTPTFTGNAASYSWAPTTGVSNPSILNPVFTPPVQLQYALTATLGTCTTQRTLLLLVTPGATANAGPDATILTGDIYQMQGSGSVGTYLWTPSIGLSSTNILTPMANPVVTTTYTLRVTTAQGCFATDDVIITVVPYCVKPMEAFTPNGDGINDFWLITNGNCLVSANAQVFNRYGAKVFESKDYRNTWDGTYKGKPLPDGTYYYIISFNLLNGKAVLLKGNLTILR